VRGDLDGAAREGVLDGELDADLAWGGAVHVKAGGCFI
jgi:hypothetical protein